MAEMNIIFPKSFMVVRVSDKGFVTLMSVLIASALGTAIAVSVILLGLGSSRSSFAVEQSHQAKALADACAEEALQQIRLSSSFAGNGNLTFGRGGCTYTVVNTGAQNRTITASGTVSTTVRRVAITINKITPKIIIVSWQEVAN